MVAVKGYFRKMKGGKRVHVKPYHRKLGKVGKTHRVHHRHKR